MIAIIAVALFGLLAVAAMLYAMQMRMENDVLRAKIYGIEIITDLIMEDE